jgi:phosphate transport system substrate-binding protein
VLTISIALTLSLFLRAMSSKNETMVLVLTLLITAGLVGGAALWFTHQSGAKIGQLQPNQSNQPTPSTTETFAQVQGVPKGEFNYGGSTSWATIRRDLDPAIQTVWPQFRLRYISSDKGKPGSGTGIRMLLDNQLSFSQSSRPVNNTEFNQAQQRGFTLKEIPVAISGTAIVVNPSLNIPGLTIAQLDDIYAGKITNWNAVGGPNLEINHYALQGDPGFNIKVVSNPTEALRRVAVDPGGMSEISAHLAVAQCTVKTLLLGSSPNELVPPYKLPFVPLDQCPTRRNQVNTEAIQSGKYPLTRRMVVVVKQDGQLDQQAGEAYANLLLTAQGQELIEKAGFVRIR